MLYIKNFMMIKYLFILVFLPVLAFGQSDTGKIDDFSLGLMTAMPTIKVPLGGAVVCQNLDLSDGILEVRPGYDSVFGFKGMDSIIGLGTLYKHDGTQYLFAVADSLAVGYGGIYASSEGSHEFGTKIDSFYLVPDTTGFPPCDFSPYFYSVEVSVATHLFDTVYSDTVYCDTFSSSCASDAQGHVNCALFRVCSVMVARLDASDVADYFTMTNHDSAFSMVEKAAYSTSIRFILWYMYKDGFYHGVQTNTVTQTEKSSASVPNRIWPYFSIQSKPRFAQFNDQLYVVNGDQRGVVIDDAHNGFIAQSYPLPAPGEPLIVPLKDTGSAKAYTLDGEYRYAIRYARWDATDTLQDFGPIGRVSAPVKVKDGRMMLRKFQLPPQSTDTGAFRYLLTTDDTVEFAVWRSKGNPGRLTAASYLFDTGLRLKIDSEGVLGDSIIIDSLADSALATDSILAVTDSLYGRDSTGALSRRYGAPTFLACDTVTDTAIADLHIMHGWPSQAKNLGVVYYVAFHDTITGNQGALSQGLAVYNAEGTSYNLDTVAIGLPQIPDGDSGMVLDLYRGQIYQVGRDTGGYEIRSDKWFESFNRIFIDSGYAVDSVITLPPRLLAQLSSSDSIYVDSVRQDSLDLCKTYTGVEPPSVLANIFPYDNYMFGYKGSQLWRSDLDSAYKWGVWNITEVDRDNGDQITLVYPGRTAMRIFKFFSNYNIWDGYTKPEIVGRWGCIAPFSYVPGALNYYLSSGGIVGETDGKQLERTVSQGLISKQLNNFDDLSMATQYGMVGQYLPTEQMALFCLGDTTYAYFEKTGSWATWDFTFGGGCLYDVEDELDFMPGKTFYFFRAGDSTIYTYGTGNTDNGDSIRVEWKSGAIYPDRWKEQVQDIGLWVESTNGDDSLILVYVLDDGGDTLSTTAFSDLNDARYHLKEVATAEPGQYFQIYIVSDKSLADTRINGIDYKYMRAEGKQAK